MDIDDVDLVEGHPGPIERDRGGQGRSHQQLPVRIERREPVGLEKGLGYVAETLGHRLFHQDQGGGTVGQG